MDSFTSIAQLLSIETTANYPSDTPANEETGGGNGGGGTYCVVFARLGDEVPVNEETGGGNGGGGTYCVVA
jgi:hypothetical protein